LPTKEKNRCEWGQASELAIAYHDTEWGVPLHDDQKWFEFIVLDGAQAGLSWETILRKRARYREVFDNFDPSKVARYTQRKIDRLLADPGIVRNKLKVNSAVRNAKAFLKIQEECGAFDTYIWDFVDGNPIQSAWRTMGDVPATTPLSDTVSKDLKQRGFNFVGSTIAYGQFIQPNSKGPVYRGFLRFPAANLGRLISRLIPRMILQFGPEMCGRKYGVRSTSVACTTFECFSVDQP
jgi:DNA-3-methyladenine glycosylase I